MLLLVPRSTSAGLSCISACLVFSGLGLLGLYIRLDPLFDPTKIFSNFPPPFLLSVFLEFYRSCLSLFSPGCFFSKWGGAPDCCSFPWRTPHPAFVCAWVSAFPRSQVTVHNCVFQKRFCRVLFKPPFWFYIMTVLVLSVVLAGIRFGLRFKGVVPLG